MTQHLEPGSYVWICPVEDNSGTPHFAKGEVKPFVVHAAANAPGPAAAPAASAPIRLVDHAFTIESPLKAGRHTIRVENAGPEPHDFGLLTLAPGKTIENVRVWLNPEPRGGAITQRSRRRSRPSEAWEGESRPSRPA